MRDSRRITTWLLLALAALSVLACAPAHAEDTNAEPPRKMVRTVRLSVRVVGNGGPARVEIPLVQSDAHQTLLAEQLLPRGFEVEEVLQDGNRLAILTHPDLEGARRFTYEFTVAMHGTRASVPPTPVTSDEPAAEDAIWVRPTRNLQSTSPLVREKLIRFATPRLAAGETDAIRIAWDLVESWRRKPDGSKTVLKALRTGHAADRGLDRLLATFLRTSGVPARPVQGVDLSRKGNRFTTWVEVKSGGAWYPMSVPRGQWGELPARYVKLSHGDRPLIARNENVEKVTFRWRVSRPPAEVSRSTDIERSEANR